MWLYLLDYVRRLLEWRCPLTLFSTYSGQLAFAAGKYYCQMFPAKNAANLTLYILAVSCALPLLSKFFSVWDLLESYEELHVYGWTSSSLTYNYSSLCNNAAYILYSGKNRDYMSCLHFVVI